MARHVFLHIGTMKAATSYLQALFDTNEELLARHGILWQGSRFNQDAVHEFQGSEMQNPLAGGAWQRMREEIRRTEGDALVSMELLAALGPNRVTRFASQLGAEQVSVILTARDLSRVAPSHWQETTQNRGTRPWTEWVEEICTGDPADDSNRAFWRHHYLPRIVEKWSEVAPTERTYLVTIPGRGGDSGAVWERLASILGVPAAEAVEPRFNNASLGAHSAELMRRLNVQLGEIPWSRYRGGFKAALAKQTLSRRAGKEPRPGLTAEQHTALRKVALGMVDEVAGRVTVIGDLQDLVPPEEPLGPAYDPGTATDAELLAAAMDGLAGLGVRTSKIRMQLDEALAKLDGTYIAEAGSSVLDSAKDRLPPGVRRRLGQVKRAAASRGRRG